MRNFHKKAEKSRTDAARRFMVKPDGPLLPVDLDEWPHPDWMTRAFKSNRYVVMVQDNHQMTTCTCIKAMVQRHDDQPIPCHWAEMQKIKNEIFGEESVGIEYYPAQSKLVNEHNIYWLFIFSDGDLPLPLK